MCTVGKEEAQLSLERLLAWAKSDSLPSGGTLGEWIFNRSIRHNEHTESTPDVPEIIVSKTKNAVQRDWKVPSEFPCCPTEVSEEPIKTYAENLKEGLIFCCNDVYSSTVSKSALSGDQKALYVITESNNGIKPWALATITFENDLFVHTSLGTFFTQEGAEKQFALAQGIEWLGGDSIDDYC